MPQPVSPWLTPRQVSFMFGGGGHSGVKRRHLVELDDLPWWPRVFRDATTDYLVAAIRRARVYDRLAPRLADAVQTSGATPITALSSCATRPRPRLRPPPHPHPPHHPLPPPP